MYNKKQSVQVSDALTLRYNELVERLYPIFEEIIAQFPSARDGAFVASSVAIRIAARIALKYRGSRRGFVSTAGKNFDFEQSKRDNTTTSPSTAPSANDNVRHIN